MGGQEGPAPSGCWVREGQRHLARTRQGTAEGTGGRQKGTRETGARTAEAPGLATVTLPGSGERREGTEARSFPLFPLDAHHRHAPNPRTRPRTHHLYQVLHTRMHSQSSLRVR